MEPQQILPTDRSLPISMQPLGSGSTEQVIYGKPHRRFKAVFGRLIPYQEKSDISNTTGFQAQKELEEATIWVEEGKTDPLIQLLFETGCLLHDNTQPPNANANANEGAES